MSNNSITLNKVAQQLNESLTKLTADNDTVDDNKVSKSGDSMSGSLTLLNQSILKLGESTVNGTNYVGLKAPAVIASDYTIVFPNVQGSNNQVLTNDGSGNLSWTTTSGTANQSLNTFDNVTFNKVTATTNFIGTLSGDVSGATTISTNTLNATNLTGTLTGDINGNVLKAAQTNITSVGTLTVLNVGGALTIENQKQIRLSELTVNGTNYIALQAPASLSGDVVLTLPNSVGSLNQALSSDGSGTLSWQSVQPLDATLTGFSSLTSTPGIVVETATDTFNTRVITGTTNQITVVNGDGVSGNPTLSLPQDINVGASPTFVSATYSGLSASQVVVTNGSKLLTSLAYTPTSSASTIASRDGSGNTVFNKLVTDNGQTQSAGQFLINSGTNSLPSLAYSGDGTSGLVFSTGNVDIATGTSRRIRVNSSGLTVDNDISCTGNLTVTGGNATITLGNLIVSAGITTLQSTLTVVSGGANITGTTTVTGSTTITGNFKTQTGTVNIATDAADDAVNISTTASGGRITSIGNTTGTSKLNLKAGSGGVFIDGVTTLNDTTESSSISTGSLIVSGGVGIAKKLYVNSLLSAFDGCTINSGTNPINIATDATTTAINIGTAASARTITVGNTTGVTSLNLLVGSGKLNVTGVSEFSDSLTVLSNGITITGDSTFNNKLTVSSGCTIDSGATNNINIATDNNTKAVNIATSGVRNITIGNTTSTTGLIFNSGSGGTSITGITTLNTTTDSSSTTTGTLIVSGGSGIAKNLYVGGLINGANGLQIFGAAVTIANDAADNTINIGTNASAGRTTNVGNTVGTSTLTLKSGSGGITMTGITTVNNTTQSTSTTTGSLIVSGGIGVAKNIISAGYVKSDNNIISTTVTSFNSSSTATAANLYNGIILVTAAATITFDLGTNIVPALGTGIAVGDTFSVLFVANGGAITLAGDTGSTLVGPASIPDGNSRVVYIRVTNVGVGTEACDIY